MRDISRIPFSNEEEFIIGTDNSGGVGTKEEDAVQAEDCLTAYFATRVALMEVLSAKGIPFAILLHNFSGDDRWERYIKGIEKAKEEAGLEGIPITGSSESNFPLKQSAIGITVLGRRKICYRPPLSEKRECYAVIGQPLVGQKVLERIDEAAPLPLFTACCRSPFILDILPVGSKGIFEELKVLSGNNGLIDNKVSCGLDIKVSGGPSTCFLIKFNEEDRHLAEALAGSFYHPILIMQ
ncbi:ATP-binding protein [Bacillus salacetis]|uniref:ATP-binding protein n=1 Tax=Bacillus salacetis TaxID=2315464 RepID=UPI003BA3E188